MFSERGQITFKLCTKVKQPLPLIKVKRTVCDLDPFGNINKQWRLGSSVSPCIVFVEIRVESSY
jgi:hypothetical protein